VSPGHQDQGQAARVSAVVVNHEAGDVLLEFVASLRAEGVKDVTVVDNASSDHSAEALVAVDPTVRLVQTGTNLGYGAAANAPGCTTTSGFEMSTSSPALTSTPRLAAAP
jgi:GT2 family glycosyltransferase